MHRTDSDRIIASLRRVLRKRKLVVLGGLVLALLPALIINAVQTPLYEATTSIVFDEIAPPVPAATEDVSRDILLSNRLEELSSYSFAEDIAAALPRAERRRFSMPEEPPPDLDTLTVIAEKIHKSILSSPVRNSNVVRLAVRLPEARLAAVVANTAARVFQERNDRIKREGAGGVRRFIEEQLVRTRTQLDAAEEGLRSYKQANRITAFDSEAQEVLRRTTEAEVLYNEARADRGAAQEKLAAIEKTLARHKRELVPSVTAASSPTVLRLRERLGELQSQYVELKLQGYPPTHPKMTQLDQAMEETKKSLTDEATKLASGSALADPIAQMQQYATEAAALQIDIESSKAQETALRHVIDDYDTQLGRLPEKEFQLARLTRERDVSHKIYTMLLEKLEETRIAEAEKLPSIRILDRALVPKDPVRPRKKLNLALGGLLGMLLGAGVALGLEFLRGGVESESELEARTGWPVLGSIPRIDRVSSRALAQLSGPEDSPENRKLRRGLITRIEPDSAAAEAYRLLRTGLQFRGTNGAWRTLLVTSVGPGEGKSTTVANLAIALATSGKRVVVVDGEVRRPVQHALFAVPRAPGLTDVLGAMEGAARRDGDTSGWAASNGDLAGVLRPTGIDRLHVLPTGSPISDRADRLANALPLIGTLLSHLNSRHDFVVVDAPPLLLVHDATLLARVADGVLFVVSSPRADAELLMRARRVLEGAGAHVLGAVLNHADPARIHGYGRYYSRSN
jgi:tyrosine-protein kinase Etk/Wzc